MAYNIDATTCIDGINSTTTTINGTSPTTVSDGINSTTTTSNGASPPSVSYATAASLFSVTPTSTSSIVSASTSTSTVSSTPGWNSIVNSHCSLSSSNCNSIHSVSSLPTCCASQTAQYISTPTIPRTSSALNSCLLQSSTTAQSSSTPSAKPLPTPSAASFYSPVYSTFTSPSPSVVSRTQSGPPITTNDSPHLFLPLWRKKALTSLNDDLVDTPCFE